MPENPNTTPILSPLLALLKSRAFVVMIVTALINMVIVAVPAFAQYRDDIITIVTALALGVIAKMAGEDIAKTLGAAKVDAEVVRAEAQGTASARAIASPADDEQDGDTKPFAPTSYPPPSRFS